MGGREAWFVVFAIVYGVKTPIMADTIYCEVTEWELGRDTEYTLYSISIIQLSIISSIDDSKIIGIWILSIYYFVFRRKKQK